MSLRQEKQERTRAALLDAAEALFRERGFDATPVDEIASRARVSRQTFFNYFPSKEQVLHELGLRWWRWGIGEARDQIGKALARSTPRARTGLAALRGWMRGIGRAIESDRALLEIVYTRSAVVMPQAPPPGGGPQSGLSRHGFDVLIDPIRRGQETGEIRSDVDPEQIAEMLYAVQSMTTRLWLMGYWKSKERLETRLVRAFDLLVDGLRRT